MSRSAFKPANRYSVSAATASLVFALSLTVSHQAVAACTGLPGTAGNDAVTCDSANPGAGEAINTDGGADTVDVSAGSVGQILTGTEDDAVSITGDASTTERPELGDGNDRIYINTTGTVAGGVRGNDGDDVLVLINGEVDGNLAADAGDPSGGSITSDTVLKTGADRIFMFGGTVTGEVQFGPGTENFTILMGGTVEATAEINRGSIDSVLVIDGATVLGGIEMQSANVASNGFLAVNPTTYLRSGFVGMGTWGGANDSRFIFDPVNSKDSTQFRDLAESGDYPSTESLLNLIKDGEGNLDEGHLLTIGPAGGDDDDDGGGPVTTPTIAFGGGNDRVDFIGAVNTGPGVHNLHFGEVGEDEEEIPVLDADGGTGPAGTNDRLEVGEESNLLLGGVQNFERLEVEDESRLTLSGSSYTFGSTTTGNVTVDGTSELHLSGEEVSFTTGHFELKAGDGIAERLTGLPSYYDDFETGGILRIGALPGQQASGDDDDDDDDEEITLLADEDDDDEEGPSEPLAGVTVTMHTGPTTFVNNGTITMLNGVVGDTFNIVGNYQSTGGNLAIDTELGDSSSPTDKLNISGTVVGTTTVYVANVGGKGAFTGQGDDDGIEIAESSSDAFAPDSFKLAVNALTGREEVLAGPFAYRLFVNDDAAVLQSDLLDQVPAYVTAPSVGQRFAASGLDTLYKRLGEIRSGYNGGATSADGRVWVRGNYSDFDVDAKEGFGFEQRNRSVLAGAGVALAKDNSARLEVGLFGGYGSADADVKAVIFGANSESSIDVDGWTGGGYITYYELGRPGTGLYFDGVFKADTMDFDMAAKSRAAGGSAEGDAFTASGEIGYGFALGGNMVLLPQGQLSYTDLSMEGFTDRAPYGLSVSYGTAESLIGRLGIQLQANLVQPGGGTISPYAIFNVLSEFEGSNESTVEGTDFKSDVSGTWYSAGGGVTAQLANNVSFYGSGEYSFGDVEGWQGTGGVKVNW